MEVPTIDLIKEKLRAISETHSQEIIDFIDYLDFKDNGFVLTEKHLELLEEGDKTSIEDCESLENFINDLRGKY